MFNGYANRETFEVYEFIVGDEGLNLACSRQVERDWANSNFELRSLVEAFLITSNGGRPEGIVWNLIECALFNVRWKEIALKLREDRRE